MKRLQIVVISVFAIAISFAQNPSGDAMVRLKELSNAKKALEEAKKKEWDAYLMRVAEYKLAKKEKKQIDSIAKAAQNVVEDTDGFTKCQNQQLPVFKVLNNTTQQEETLSFMDFFSKHVAAKFHYPTFAIEHNVSGTVFVQFSIDKEGNPKIMDTKGPEYGMVLEEEAIRIIKAMPTCTPAFCDGKPVNVSFTVPIKFQMED